MLTHGEQLLAEWKHPDPITGEQLLAISGCLQWPLETGLPGC
jgi:hypothetical protein